MGDNTELTTKAKLVSIRDAFNNEAFKENLNQVCSSIITGEKMANIALLCIQKTPQLLDCSIASLTSALKTLAAMGCAPDGRHGYLVPRWNNKSKSYTATPIPSAQGLARMARKVGVKGIHWAAVRANDAFTWSTTQDGFQMVHTPSLLKKADDFSDILGFYCVWKDQHDEPCGEYMSKDEIDAIRNRCGAKDRNGNIVGPWVTDYEQMALKTVVKRAAKHWDFPEDALFAMQQADEQEFEQPTQRGMRMASGRKPLLETETEEEPIIDNEDDSDK